MTEAEWLAATDPWPMLEHLRDKASARKLRHFALALLGRAQQVLGPHLEAAHVAAIRKSIESLEGQAAAPPAEEEAAEHSQQGWQPYSAGYWDAYGAFRQISKLFHRRSMQQIPVVREWDWQADGVGLLRDVFGNPFRVAPNTDHAWPSWQGGTVPRLALAAYEDHRLPEGTLDPARLAVLADALEDAGCADAELLGHLRSPGPHVPGCWALDLLCGKE